MDGVVIIRWDNSGNLWDIARDVILDTAKGIHVTSYATRAGPDSGDEWRWEETDSGDSWTLRQFDSSVPGTIDRIKIIGKGASVTDEGDIILTDKDGVETARWDESAGEWIILRQELRFEVSEKGDLTTKTGEMRWYPPYDIELIDESISVGTAPTGASILVDTNKNGTTVFTTQANRPEIAISGFFDVSGTPDVIALTGDTDYLTWDIDQVGSTIAGKDLVIQTRYKRV